MTTNDTTTAELTERLHESLNAYAECVREAAAQAFEGMSRLRTTTQEASVDNLRYDYINIYKTLLTINLAINNHDQVQRLLASKKEVDTLSTHLLQRSTEKHKKDAKEYMEKIAQEAEALPSPAYLQETP